MPTGQKVQKGRQECGKSKEQIPKSKIQIPNKVQNPNFKQCPTRKISSREDQVSNKKRFKTYLSYPSHCGPFSAEVRQSDLRPLTSGVWFADSFP